MRVSEECCVKKAVSDFKRDDRIRNPPEAPVRDKQEVLRWGFERRKTVTELAGGPEVEPYVAIRADEKSICFLQ
jgi:hypothetical protein